MARGLRTLIALCVALAALVLATLAWSADGAEAAGINGFSMTTSSTQAGGHPDWSIAMSFENRDTVRTGCECQDVEEIEISAPTGFIGNPHALPKCTLLQFSLHKCPSEAQVGIVEAGFPVQVPMMNMEPHPEQPGLVGFELPLINSPAFIDLAARTEGDYGLNTTSQGITHLLPLREILVYLWGVPGDDSHDRNRFPNPQPGSTYCAGNTKKYPLPCNLGIPFNGPVKPFLQNPTTCGVPLTGGLDLRYYDFSQFHAETVLPPTTGCDQLSFDPSLTAKPTTTQADTPAGLDVNLVVPQPQSPTTPTPSQIRATTVTLPEGFALNPNAADGKQVCTDAEAFFETRLAAQCPEHAKVGTLVLDSSALPGPIDGAIYLGEPKPGDKYRLVLAADGFSTHVKLAGSVHLDPSTGQIIVEFDDLPQSPLSEFNMHFFGAERGLLVTPTHCGTYEVTTEFVPWNSALPDQTSTAFFTVDSGPGGSPCPAPSRPFSPQLKAGMADNTAASHSTFAVRVDRSDGDQNLARLTVTAPPGLSAVLKGLPYCPDSALAALAAPGSSGFAEQVSPTCPRASQIGTTMTEVGAGSRPLHAPGKVYLAGPYQGAPLSLVVVVPAVSGPYDLGNVAVRAAIQVDPVTAQVTTVSDPLPQIIDGIPLRLRSILVSLDHPNFMLNPTNCDPFAVQTQIFGIQGAIATPSTHFQVANCADLPFAPRLSMRLSGGVNRRGHPAIRAVFQTSPGEANAKRVSVALPPDEQLDNAHIGTVCTRVNFAKDACPPDSVYGSAEAISPLLDEPLRGNVYLRSSSNQLPDLVVDLDGQFEIELAGRIDTAKGGGLRTTFETVPDAPVSTFVLNLAGGKKGLLVNTKTLCGKPKWATVRMVGQNGVAVNSRTKLQAACGSKARHKRSAMKSRKAGR